MIFTTDGSEPVERRQIVDNEKCNVCHSDLRLHGSLRVGVEYCVMCHNPNGTDISRRPAEMLPPETINFKDMVHQIHRGADLETDYTVFGFGSTPFDFTHIGFPGDLRNCEICHVEGSYELPLAEEVMPTVISDGESVVSEKLPERAACTSCHDSLITEVHAILASEVLPNTGAAKAGVQTGDAIISCDGKPIPPDPTTVTFIQYIQSHPPGTTVKVEVLREEKVLPFDVVLGGRPAEARGFAFRSEQSLEEFFEQWRAKECARLGLPAP